jgi:hypothetical protein
MPKEAWREPTGASEFQARTSPVSLPSEPQQKGYHFRDAADLYVRLRWKIFPLKPGSKEPFQGSHGVKDATNDIGTIYAWHARVPNSNIGIACGASTLMVVDLDPRHGCWQTLERWKEEGKHFPQTVRARTRSGGLHLYFRMEQPLPDGWKRKLPGGIDIQVGNKYVVAPPSIIHPDKVDDGQGGAYRWEQAPIGPHLLEPPQWLLDMLKPPPTTANYSRGYLWPSGSAGEGASRLERQVQGALRKVANAPEGHRNDELNNMAHLLGRLVVESGLDYQWAEARLVEAGMAANPGVGQKATLATVRSGLQKGMAHAGRFC